VARRTGWVDVRLPGRPNTAKASIEARHVRLERTLRRVVIDVGARRVTDRGVARCIRVDSRQAAWLARVRPPGAPVTIR
jgi:hypothetical protein